MYRTTLSIFVALVFSILATAQVPQCSPTATYITDEGEVTTTDTIASAPITGIFRANPTDADGVNPIYIWNFYHDTTSSTPYLTRYGEETEMEFLETGRQLIELTMTYTDDNGNELSNTYDPLAITISESRLEFPNAFSPNGDGINDVFKAKEGWKSLVEFHAYIYNRWGQKLYEWTDPDGGWDGTHNGKDVKQGVYFVMVRAKGADGREFNIKRDVNLLRGFTENQGTLDQ